MSAPVCPRCGSHQVALYERTLVLSGVKAVSIADGEIQVDAFDGAIEPDFQNAERVDAPWRCRECRAEFTDEAMVKALQGAPEAAHA